MKVWTNNKFHGHYPVGAAAVVVADTAEQAAHLLNIDLKDLGLGAPATADQFQALDTSRQGVRVLCDGDY